MKSLTLSRVALAQIVGVDKSLVGRWVTGTVRPTEHNLSRITLVIAERQPAFTMADWDRDIAGFAALLGIDLPEGGDLDDPAESLLGPFLKPWIDLALFETRRHGHAYEGFWRTSRASFLMPDTIFHDYGMIRKAANGLLEVRMSGSGLPFRGWMLPAEGNVFVMLQDVTGYTPMSLIFRAISLPKAMTLDGLLLLAARDANRTPAAIPILMERVADLSGDAVADDACCADLGSCGELPIAPVDEATLKSHLIRDTGPSAAREGGDLFLSTAGRHNLSRGATSSGSLSG